MGQAMSNHKGGLVGKGEKVYNRARQAKEGCGMPWSEWVRKPIFWLVCYLIIINLVGFAMMGIDKYKAKHERWRIRERTLMLTAAVGGSVGVFCGMRVFRHKTLHNLFRWGVPAIMAVQAALAVYLIWFRG